MVKRKLNQEEQSEVYLTILETLAANYAEVRGRMSSTWLNLPVDLIKAENKNEVELSRGKIGVEDRH
jgi:alpha-D-ribose 1-methylphosphonate 5-triphosphate synthase subunit PhnL